MISTAPRCQTEIEQPEPASPCAIAIFGAAGDLTKRLLMPALYNLAKSGLLPKEFAIIGVAHTDLSSDEFRTQMSRDIKEFATQEVDSDIWNWINERLDYLQGDFKDPNTYLELQKRLSGVDKEKGTSGNYLFYLATSPSFFKPIVEGLGKAKLTKESDEQWRRVIIEKPFGQDLDSARSLNQDIFKVLDENQVYRIDHYLGKETVQNLMVFRFANGVFEPIWNRNHIDHVQITVSETVGVEKRGNYYDQAGALRDMIPNHLFQLLALTAMEAPTCFAADAVRDEKTKLFHAVQAIAPEEVDNYAVRGQYDQGQVGDKEAKAYRDEPRVDPDSNTESYVALKLLIDNWRWAGVPFYLRTGKYMPQRTTEIAIQFKQAPFTMFKDTPVECLTPNFLLIQIQPKERISLQIGAKVPGPKVNIDGVEMDFSYKDRFGAAPQTGYETLIYDCLIGDATLFQRADNTEAAWKIVDPILEAWKQNKADFPNYTAGTWGPKSADELLERDGRQWRVMSVE
ncbi:glucose-6-phosphate dehydrogenase [Pleurocapsa sp. FMAR1]|uniref:glucose-6-phosphate dehydrogenase n=1 Tax=Pleurocapsa sp. FMAR1 TaxID=3040204 RepID=UPI0029C7C0AF|nr:glucose-6-phosphate dehydrogenase [Pleurocapsa sp. FMAR1]